LHVQVLNGGPGAPAFVYVSRSCLASKLALAISGWFGHAEPFAFASGLCRPKEGVARFAAGTPGVLSLSALDAALDVFDGVETMRRLQRKARALGDLCRAHRGHRTGVDFAGRGKLHGAAGM
jgi:kynureninase